MADTTPPSGGADTRPPTQKAAEPTEKFILADSGDATIRPFNFHASDEDLADLKRRIAVTRWPDRELVDDASQGVKLDTIQKLAAYWLNEHDWRKVEARINSFPNFITNIDGVDIHFIHVKSKHNNALPLIVTHGWPGSIVEQLKIIEPLTDPTAHGGTEEDAFDVVIPSLPGYGFSRAPTDLGWGPERIARAWVVLMKRLGYARFVAQGGDWGAMVTDVMGTQAPPELLGIHLNWPFTVPPDIDAAIQSGKPMPSDLSADEQRAWERLDFFYKHGVAYAQEMSNRPQTLYGTGTRPSGLRLGFLITTRSATRSLRVYLTASVRGLRGTTSSTTLRSTGSQTRPYLRGGSIGKISSLSLRRSTWPSRSHSAPFLTRSVKLRGRGWRRLIRGSFITTGLRMVGTSRPGSNRNSSRKNYALASGRCVRNSGAGDVPPSRPPPKQANVRFPPIADRESEPPEGGPLHYARSSIRS